MDDAYQSRTVFLVTTVVIASRFLSVWIALGVLVVAALVFAPATLSRASFSAVLPFASFLAIAALGAMDAGITTLLD